MTVPLVGGIEDPLIGRVIQGRFQVLERLAAGGMGVVYKAEQQPLGRMVALKILDGGKTPDNDGNFSKRFFLEASAAAKLAHPNTIVVHDYGQTDDGLFFIAMELLDGGTLGHRLKTEGPLMPDEAIHVGLQVVSSLSDAHQRGLVHRDLKPGNIMFAPRGGDPLFVKVLDFGLVKVVGEADLQLTQSGVMMGSPRYMAPEQVKAQPVDSRTDIYSFGAVMYHALSGAPPFSAGSAFEAMNHHVYTDAPPLRAAWPGCPAGPKLEGVILKCLAKEAMNRFQSMDEVMRALKVCHGEAGGSIAGAGSYLSRPGSSDSGSYSNIPPNAMGAPSPQIQHVNHPNSTTPGWVGVGAVHAPQYASDSGSIANSHIAATRAPSPTYQATQRFDPANLPSSAAAASSSSQSGQYAPGSSSSSMIGVAPPPKRRSWLTLILGLLVLVLAGGAAVLAVLLVPMEDLTELIALDQPPQVVTPAEDPVPDEPVSEETPPQETTPVAVETPREATPPVAVERPVRGRIEAITLNTDPQGAAVRRDGADLGDTPLPLLIPLGESWTIEVTLRGYETRNVTVAAGGQSQLTLNLIPERPVIARRPRRRPPVRPLPPPPVTRPVIRRPPPSRTGNIGQDGLDNPWGR